MEQITWNKERIQRLLAQNDHAVERALLALYLNQTPAEQANANTVENNGTGFNGADAEILTSFAQFYLRTRHLSRRQLDVARSRLPKYWRQLLAAAERKGHQVQYN